MNKMLRSNVLTRAASPQAALKHAVLKHPVLKHAVAAALALVAVLAGSTTVSAQPRSLDRVVAVVNTEVITAGELDSRTRAITTQMKRQNIEIPPDDVLRPQVLDRMIIDRAQVQLARDVGVRVDDNQLDRAVASVAEQNKLTVEQLRQRLEREGSSFSRFREELRTEIIVNRLREREVDARLQIGEADIDSFLQEQSTVAPAATEYNVAQILLRLPESANAEQITRTRLRAEELVRQAQKGVDFARLAASFSDGPEAMSGGAMGWRSDDRLPQLFVDALKALPTPEDITVVRSPNGFHVLKLLDRRALGRAAIGSTPVKQTKARHILVRPTEVLAEAEVLRRLREIKQRVEQGAAKFEDMAKQYSSDANATVGGDLGWVYQGDTVPEFEQAMDALALGKISDPVRTPFGYHLIEVLERRTNDASPDRVRQQARQAIRERRTDEAYQDWLRQLRDRTYVELRLE